MGVRSERFLPSKAILEPFRDLPNDDREVRINAAKSIILEVQAEDDQKEATTNYALVRLIKGLNSDHDSSRLGFSMALTEVRSPIETLKYTRYVYISTDAKYSVSSCDKLYLTKPKTPKV